MAGTLAAGHPSRSEPRGAKLRRVVDRGRKGLARLDRLIESRPWFAPALIVVAGALVTVPLALFGFVFGDIIHLVWAKHFSDQLWAGNLYPRWLLDMNSGLGSPTFYFYGPVSYYITSLFFLVLPYHGYGWLQVGLSAALASVGSGLAAYLWLRQGSSRRAASIAAALYTWLPYHLRIDHVERFAFAEYWGFVWMPLSLYYVTRLLAGHRRSIAGLAITYALLLMTHPPTALLFGCIPFLYACSLAVEVRSYKPLVQVAAAMVLGSALAAIYLLPALTTQSSASIPDMFLADVFYANSFLFVTLPSFAGEPIWFQAWLAQMTKLTFVAGSIAALLAFTGLWGPRRPERIFWSGIVVFSLMMMHPLSAPLWRAIPLLQRVQFPWRFHILVCLATLALIAYAIDALPVARMQRWRSIAFALAMLVIGLDGLYTLKVVRWDVVHGQRATVREADLIKNYPEYRTKWTPRHVYTPERVKELSAVTPPVQTVSGPGQAWIQKWSPTEIQIGSNAAADMQVQVKQFYYPTWTATLENGEACATSASPEGLLVINLPPGRREVSLSIEAVGPGLLGQRISLMAVVVTLGLFLGLRDSAPKKA